MNEDLRNEVEAINSIYGDDTIVGTLQEDVYVLRLEQQETSLRLQFPDDYPSAPPAVLGTESSGEHKRKGEAAHVLELFRHALGRLYQPGEVCLYDVIEDVNSSSTASVVENQEDLLSSSPVESTADVPTAHDSQSFMGIEPPWTTSDVVVELKSVFVARSALVSSPDQAKQYLQHLLHNDKKIRSATHNITAWRIKGENGATYQDCDDDGENAAGGRVLHLMQLMELWNVMVVVTRWYGGHQLGPKRFSIINTVARDAFVKGGFVKEDTVGSKKKGKK